MARNLIRVTRRISHRAASAAFLALLLAFWGPADALAQDTGTVTGTITDENQKPLPGAQVVVVGTQRGSVTDGQGTYTISGTPTGQIEVQAKFVGYKAQTKLTNLDAGETVRVDFQLAPDMLQMDEAVVTGSFQERSKMESSVAVTTVNSAQIEEQNAKNITDLMKAVPGMWVESSGGASGNNVFTRGIPAGGKLRYLELNHNGLPVFESNGLDFANTDQFFRSDKTIRTMESVRGGTASIFNASAPAGTMNFRSKTGGEELAGLVKVEGGTTADHVPGRLRADFNLGGPFSEDWRFNVGGFYRFSEGTRDAGFAGDKGGQVNANITRFLDNGYVRVYGRYMNEQNIFYLPVPLVNPSDPEGVEGFDANFGTMANQDAALARVPSPDGSGFVNRDLTRGINPELRSLQTDLVFDITDRLSIENKLKAMNMDLVFNAAFSLDAPFDAESFATSQVDNVQSFNYEYTYSDEDFNPSSANGNGLVSEFGWWHVDKPMSNIIDQLELTFDTERHSLTGGLYFSHYNVEELWHWHNMLTDVQGNPRMLDLTVTDADGTTYQVSENGFSQFGTTYTNHEGTGTILAAYAGDEWEVTDQVRVDIGGRLEKSIFRGKSEGFNPRTIDLDDDPTTLYNNGVAVAGNNVFTYQDSHTEWALSGGINYSLSEQYAVFGRFSRGFHMPDLDNYRGGGSPDPETVLQGELGVKVNTSKYGAFITAFWSSLTDIPFDDQTVDDEGNVISNQTRFIDTVTPGVEIEVNSQFNDFEGTLRATLQNPTYSDQTLSQDVDQDGELEDFNIGDNRVRRQPRYLVSFRPQYDFGAFQASTSVSYVDERFTTDTNTGTVLPDYWEWDASVWTNQGPVTVRLSGTNLTNSLGLTEGNPRTSQIVGQQRDIFMARPILGRQFKLSMTYNF